MGYTARKVRPRSRAGELDGLSRFYLCMGWCLGHHHPDHPLPGARHKWEQNKGELLAYWQQDPERWQIPEGGSRFHWPRPGGPGTLPWAALQFDALEQKH